MCGVVDNVDDDGERFIQLSFCNPYSSKLAQLRFYEDGTMCIGTSISGSEREGV